jgi:hypothetical protein
MADDDAQQGQVQVCDPARESCSDERGGGQRHPATGIGFRLAACVFPCVVGLEHGCFKENASCPDHAQRWLQHQRHLRV